jgi:hypothetical protein
MEPEGSKRLTAELGASGAALVVLAAFVYLSMRWSLLALVVVAVPYLTWTRIRQRARLIRRLGLVVACAAVLAAIPMDLVCARTGHWGIGVRPLIWGLPGRQLVERADRGEVVLGGCVVPLFPARDVLLLSW